MVDGSMSEGQVAAFAMAVYFHGLTLDECAALTRDMTCSGAVLDVRVLGDAVSPDRAIAVVRAIRGKAKAAATMLRAAVTVGEDPGAALGSPVLRRIGARR